MLYLASCGRTGLGVSGCGLLGGGSIGCGGFPGGSPGMGVVGSGPGGRGISGPGSELGSFRGSVPATTGKTGSNLIGLSREKGRIILLTISGYDAANLMLDAPPLTAGNRGGPGAQHNRSLLQSWLGDLVENVSATGGISFSSTSSLSFRSITLSPKPMRIGSIGQCTTRTFSTSWFTSRHSEAWR